MASRTTLTILSMRRQRVLRAHRAAVARRNAWLFRFIAMVSLVGFSMALVVSLVFVGSAVASYAAYVALMRDLPSAKTIGTQTLPETTMIYDRNGVLLYEVVDPEEGKRTSIPLSDVPTDLIKATIAVEDATYFENPGVDVRGIGRAFMGNFQAGRVTSGASTITQQLVKNSVLGPEVSYTRKIREAILAYRLDRTYSKEQILELYLNQNNYGNHSYGVEAAAEAYFGKKAKDLDLAECAMLAGLPQAPSVYNPVVNMDAAKSRQREVLDAMVLHGLLDPASANKAYAEPLKIQSSKTVLRAPHFVFYVLNQLVQRFGYDAVYRGGLRVQTTLDYNLEQQAEKIAQQQVAAVKSHNVSDAAVVAINPKTGEIVTMLGSADYNDDSIEGKFNVAIARRQPGSAIKPITYATTFEKGWSPSTVLVDSKTEFPTTENMWNGSYVPRPGDPAPYEPNNYDMRFHGPLPIRDALGNSLNIPAVKAIMYAGVPDVIDTAQRMGITTFDRGDNVYGLSLTLGGGEVTLLQLTSAYGVFADGGVRHPPVAWIKVTDRNGRVLDQLSPGPGEQVISPQVAFLTTSILSDDSARALEFGTNSGLKLSRPAAAKTGTTDSFRDNWTVGYTPNLVTGVWVGNANNDKMIDIIGITGAGPIWHDFMEAAIKPLPVEDFTVPPGMVRERVSNLTGLLVPEQPVASTTRYRWTVGPDGKVHYEYLGKAAPKVTTSEPSHDDWFIEGTEPTMGTYRTGTYRAYWGTGQIAMSNCPPYMVDERVWGPVPPPPGEYDCVHGKSTYNPLPLLPSQVGTPSPDQTATFTGSTLPEADQTAGALLSSFPAADQTAIAQALTPQPITTPVAIEPASTAAATAQPSQPTVTSPLPSPVPRPARATPRLRRQ